MLALIKWAGEKGIDCTRVTPAAEGRNLLAARDLQAADAFLRVPQDTLLHVGAAQRDPVYGPLFSQLELQADAEMDARYMLCLLLILERAKGSTSAWAPYIDFLPTAYEDPLWWKETEVALLKGTRLEIAVTEHQKILQKLAYWRNHLVDLERQQCVSGVLETFDRAWALSHQALLWAKSTVWSRAFNIPFLGGVDKPGIALVPVGDLLDHDNSRHVGWHTGPLGTDSFHFLNYAPIKKGSVLYSNYGYKSNEELILGYGFALANNPANFFHVMIGLADKPNPELQGEGREEAGPDERIIQRRALLQHLGLPTSHYLKPLPGTASVPLRPLLNASAVCLMPDHLAYHWWSAPAGVKPKRKPGTEGGPGKRVGVGAAVGARVGVGIGVQPATTGPAGTGAEGRSVAAGPLQRPDSSVSDQTDFPGQVEVKGVLAANSIPPQLAVVSGLHAAGHTQWSEVASDQTPVSGNSSHKDPPASLPQEPDPQLGAVDPRGRLGDPFSCCPTHVQLEVLSSLHKLLQSKLNAIAGRSAPEDEWLAHQPDCTPAARMALLFRVDQKCIAAAALHSLADVATEVVCGAGHATSSSESLQRPWSESAEAQAEEQRANHMQNFQHQWGVMLDGVQQTCSGQKLNSLEWPSEPCGLVTTRAIAHGDGLVAVPRQAVLFTADPEQLITEIALLAKPHMASILGPGHSAQDDLPCEVQLLAQNHLQTSGPVVGSLAKTTQQQANLADASGTHHQDTNLTLAHAAQQPNVSSTHGLDTVPSHDDNTSAAAAHQKALLAELVKLWLRIGGVQLGWTAQLLLALLCKGHPQHAAARAELNALAGLPQEDAIMIEVQELAARLEPFVGSPVLGPLLVTPGFSEPDWGNPAIEQSRMGTAAVLWAMSCIEQCSKPDPCGTGFILADTISALPQELLGTVADLSWESTGHLLLTAACDLPADTPLTPALVASRAEPAHLLHMHGPSALAWAQQQATARQQTANMQAQHRRDHQTVSMQVQPHSNPDIPHTQLHQLPSKQDQLGSSEDKSKGELPPCSAKQAAAQHQQPSLESVCAWQASEAASFELCMEPSPQDMARGAKLLLLQASTLGTSHFLTRRSSQERLLAALVLSASSEAEMSQLGGPALLTAFQHSQSYRELAASSDSPSSGKQDALEEAEQSLHQQQQQFVANLLSDPARRQIAQELLCSLLVQEQMQLAEAGDAAVATRGSSNGFPAAAALQELHEDVLQILAHHIKLCTTKHTRKHKHKKSESSKRSKRHKQQS